MWFMFLDCMYSSLRVNADIIYELHFKYTKKTNKPKNETFQNCLNKTLRKHKFSFKKIPATPLDIDLSVISAFRCI